MTIDEAITQVEALNGFYHVKHDKGKWKEIRNSYAKGREDCDRGIEQQTHPKQYGSYKSDEKLLGSQNYTKRKAKTTKGDGCYICDGLHSYARCPEIKNLHEILQEWK